MQLELLTIINHYGYRHQLKKLNEEVYELIEAIIDHNDDGARYATKAYIEEELADVLVLLNQFNEYYDLNFENIENIMQQKINRQLERMKEEKENE